MLQHWFGVRVSLLLGGLFGNARKKEGKRFIYLLLQFPLCGHETEYEEYNPSNYKSSRTAHALPKRGRSADQPGGEPNTIPASSVFPEGPGRGKAIIGV